MADINRDLDRNQDERQHRPTGQMIHQATIQQKQNGAEHHHKDEGMQGLDSHQQQPAPPGTVTPGRVFKARRHMGSVNPLPGKRVALSARHLAGLVMDARHVSPPYHWASAGFKSA
jgi:hypothetical protein